MSRPAPARAALVAALLAAAALAAACGGGGDTGPAPAGAGEAGATGEPDAVETQPEEASVTPLRRKEVEVYFPSALENGLVSEFREIFDTATPGDRAKQIIAELIAGPATDNSLRSLQPSTQLRQVFVTEDGTAYLDFAAGLAEGARGGSMRELLLVYSVVDSVVLNIPEIVRVAILVNGRPVETLNGHLDLRRPLPPDHRIIIGSVVVDAAPADEPVRVAEAARP